MREAFNITGKILLGIATPADHERLEHLCCDEAKRLKGMAEILRQQEARDIGIRPAPRRSALSKETGE
jgi:hypothetical protein